MKIVSFGFKYGQPRANHYFDVSWIKNPARGEGRNLFSALDTGIINEVLQDQAVKDFLTKVIPLLEFLSKKDVMVVAFGCSAGRHRSPVIAEAVAKTLAKVYKIDVTIEHRDIKLC